MYLLNAMMHYDEEFSKTILNNVNDDECMQANACMLPKVICE